MNGKFSFETGFDVNQLEEERRPNQWVMNRAGKQAGRGWLVTGYTGSG